MGSLVTAGLKQHIEVDPVSGRVRRKVLFGDDDEDDENAMDADGAEDDEDDEEDDGEDDDDDDEQERAERRKLAKNNGMQEDDEEDELAYAESDSDLGSLGEEEEDGDDADAGQSGEDGLDEDEMEVDDEDDEEESQARWKNDLLIKAHNMFEQGRRVNLMKLVYGDESSKRKAADADRDDDEEEGEEEDVDENGLFKKSKRSAKATKADVNGFDAERNLYSLTAAELIEWNDDDVSLFFFSFFCFLSLRGVSSVAKSDHSESLDPLLLLSLPLFQRLDSLRVKFITGGSAAGANGEGAAEGDEEMGEFEDLEGGDDEKADEEETETGKTKEELEREAIKKRKEELKAKFNSEYDGEGEKEGGEHDPYEELKREADRQAQLNRSEFADLDPSERVQYEGYSAGMYVRLVIEGIPCEFVENFDPRFPVIIGGLLPSEENFGFLQARVKKHRWHRKILKTNDPLIFSIGWRRFQSIPIFSMNDNTRNRMLKYTPQHMHCLATFYGGQMFFFRKIIFFVY
jgi:ribosome biogenesis protein BMS1